MSCPLTDVPEKGSNKIIRLPEPLYYTLHRCGQVTVNGQYALAPLQHPTPDSSFS